MMRISNTSAERSIESMESDAKAGHQAGQVRAAQHQKARGKAEGGRQEPGANEGDGGLDDDLMLGEKARRVGSDAEKGRMAQRDDPGIAKDEIERKREQAPDRGFGQDEMTARQEIDGREGREPERELKWTEARAASQKTGKDSVDLAAHRVPTRQLPCRAAGKQTLRTQDQDHDHDGIDHEGTDGRNLDDDFAYLP